MWELKTSSSPKQIYLEKKKKNADRMKNTMGIGEQRESGKNKMSYFFPTILG